jgi:uncharacterized membrane protein
VSGVVVVVGVVGVVVVVLQHFYWSVLVVLFFWFGFSIHSFFSLLAGKRHGSAFNEQQQQ